MRRHSQVIAWTIAAGIAGPGSAAPPINAYGQLPTLGDIALSPDGTRWAGIVGDADKSEVQVRELLTGKLLLASPARDYKLRALQWADNDRIMLTLSQTKQLASTDYLIFGRGEYFQLLMHDLKTHQWVRPMRAEALTANFVAGPPVVRTVDGRAQMVVEGQKIAGSAFASTLFRIDPVSGRSIALETGSADTVDWLIGVDGKPVARADYVRKDGLWRLMFKRGDFWKEVYREQAPIDLPALVGLGRVPGTILVGSRKSGDYEVYEVALATATWSAPIEGHGDALVSDPTTRQPVGTVDEGLGTVSYEFWNLDDQKLWRSISRGFKDEIVRFVDWSADRNVVMIEVFGPKSGDAIYVVDRKAKTAGLLGQRYERLAAADLGPVRTLIFKAGDGTEIPAYLTLPPGREASNLPLIALPHGGPEASDRPGFDWWAQALASRGYAVLQPQFRGSSGFGNTHRNAGYGQWGRRMQTDISDGVRHLAGVGTIDPKRVCIVGASYGGYAALAGVTIEQGIYRCAASIAGVSDLRRMLQRETGGVGSANPTVRYWRRFMGAESTSDTRIDALSPARLAARVAVPVQLIHGKDDLVVPMEQSKMMASALDAAGKPAEYVVLASEDHWLSRPATRVAMLEALVGFLEKHNPPGTLPPPPVAGR